MGAAYLSAPAKPIDDVAAYCRKLAHLSREDAMRTLRKTQTLRKSSRDISAQTTQHRRKLGVYKCRFCGAWHVGSKKI